VLFDTGIKGITLFAQKLYLLNIKLRLAAETANTPQQGYYDKELDSVSY
jgi:hypothetical protein